MKLYAFVDAQKTDFEIIVLCRVVGVSTSGYYQWTARIAAGPSNAELDDAVVLERIRVVHRKSKGRYGQPRVTAELARQGDAVNHKRVQRLMSSAGIVGRGGRKKIRTTVRDPAAALSADLVGRQFAQPALNMLWVGDATYIPTGEGWLYLATVLDACSRRLLGWSITDHLRSELCLDALHAAVGTRGGKHNIVGVKFHSDHGCQYTSDAFHDDCATLESHSRWAPSATPTTVSIHLLMVVRWEDRRRRCFWRSDPSYDRPRCPCVDVSTVRDGGVVTRRPGGQ